MKQSISNNLTWGLVCCNIHFQKYPQCAFLIMLTMMLSSTIPIEASNWLRPTRMSKHAAVYTSVSLLNMLIGMKLNVVLSFCIRILSNCDHLWPVRTETALKPTHSRIFPTATSTLTTSWNRKTSLARTGLTDLHKDDSIIVTKPDKGNSVVIINKLGISRKMKALIFWWL